MAIKDLVIDEGIIPRGGNTKPQTLAESTAAALPDTAPIDASRNTKPVPTDQASCQAAGGAWTVDPSTGNGSCTLYEKDPAIANITPTSQTPVSSVPSPTATTAASQAAGKPLAQSVASNFQGEVAGLGAKAKTLREMEIKRDFDEGQTRAAQNWAAKGMSYSQPFLDDAVDQFRQLANARVLNAQEAERLQNELNQARFAASEPIEKLAAGAKLGGNPNTPNFQPGFIPSSAFGGGLAAVGATPTTSLPTVGGMVGTPSAPVGDAPDAPDASVAPVDNPTGLARSAIMSGEEGGFVDEFGFSCDIMERDEAGNCPDNPRYRQSNRMLA